MSDNSANPSLAQIHPTMGEQIGLGQTVQHSDLLKVCEEDLHAALSAARMHSARAMQMVREYADLKTYTASLEQEVAKLEARIEEMMQGNLPLSGDASHYDENDE